MIPFCTVKCSSPRIPKGAAGPAKCWEQGDSARLPGSWLRPVRPSSPRRAHVSSSSPLRMRGYCLKSMDSFSAIPRAGVRYRMRVPDVFTEFPNAISSFAISVPAICPHVTSAQSSIPAFGIHGGKEQKQKPRDCSRVHQVWALLTSFLQNQANPSLGKFSWATCPRQEGCI